MNIVFLLALLACGAISCGKVEGTDVRAEGQGFLCPSDGTMCVQRIVDKDYGVVCYKYPSTGISCVRIEP